MKEPTVIAIDGPAASGKGTLARGLAAALGLPHLDTGLLYRAVARRLLDLGAEPTDEAAAIAAARLLRPEDLARDDLRGPKVDNAASQVSALPLVRAALLGFQRQFARARGAVLDGRDIGTVIFPDAAVKFFVTASLATRAQRRQQELMNRGLRVNRQQVTEELIARDAADAAREVAPLTAAPDAIWLDTTGLDVEAVLAEALAAVRQRLARV